MGSSGEFGDDCLELVGGEDLEAVVLGHGGHLHVGVVQFLLHHLEIRKKIWYVSELVLGHGTHTLVLTHFIGYTLYIVMSERLTIIL